MNTAVKKDEHPVYKISRDWSILELKHEGLTVKEIALRVGVTEGCVRHTLTVLKTIEDRGDIYEYIDLGSELCLYLDEAGCDTDVDRCMSMIMRELWARGFNTTEKIAKLTKTQIDDILMSHRVARVGGMGTGAFLDWLKALKDRVREKSKKSSK